MCFGDSRSWTDRENGRQFAHPRPGGNSASPPNLPLPDFNHTAGNLCYAGALSLDSNPENRCSVRLSLTAIASAFRWPTTTTSSLPRVMPV